MIDPKAVVDPRAELADDVVVGAFSIIGPDVHIDAGTWIGPHVVIKGPTRIGRDNKIFQFASLGEAPQDKKYHGEPTELVVGDRNQIREFVTLNRGTVQGRGRTVIGSDNLIMAYVHVAHDCVVGDNVIMSNAASLAGHVQVDDYAILSGFTLVHQFCRIGAHAFTSMGSAVNRDVPPYVLAAGNYAKAYGINKEGLRRRGFSPEQIGALHKAFKLLVKSHNREQGLREAEALAREHAPVAQLLEFVRNSARGIVR